MGACAGKKTDRQGLSTTKRTNIDSIVSEDEVNILKMMYDDLACRSKEKLLTREVFDTFFHLNGLWGQEMFRIFDRSKHGTILFD